MIVELNTTYRRNYLLNLINYFAKILYISQIHLLAHQNIYFTSENCTQRMLYNKIKITIIIILFRDLKVDENNFCEKFVNSLYLRKLRLYEITFINT